MNNKILRIMPFVLGFLVIILTIVLIVTSGEDKDKDTKINIPTQNEKKQAEADDKKTGVVDVIEPEKKEEVPEVTDTPVEPEDIPEDDPENNKPVRDEGNEFGLTFVEKQDFVDIKDGVNLRAGASTDTSVIVCLEKGKRLERTGYNDEWTRVIYDGIECYVATRLVLRAVDKGDEVVTEPDDSNDNNENENPTGEGEEFGMTFEEKSDYVELKPGINLRSGASTDTSVAAFLENTERLQRIGYNKDWTKVIYDGKTCYVATFLVVKTMDSLDAVNDADNADTATPDNTDADATTDTGAGTDTNTDNNSDTDTDNDTNTDNTADTTETETAGQPEIANSAGASSEGKTSRAAKVICIDPGHQSKGNYGTEPVGPNSTTMKTKVSSGTQGKYTGLEEYKLNLDVSMALKDELTARGYTVIMTRTTNDVNITNVERAQIANDAGVDAFVRIHANGSDSSSVKGIETICQTKNNQYNAGIYKECRNLSDCVLEGMVNATGASNRGVWETDTMTGINWCQVPVTIVEMGFMTNEEEDRLLSTKDYQKKIIKGIADGIDDYFDK